MKAINQLNSMYEEITPQHERYGQFFVNRFIGHPWPELFHERDREKAQQLICQWLIDNQYQDCLPRFSKQWEERLLIWR